MNSFLSTSLDYSLAETWAGNGEDRPKFESVIFEIIIDECKFENVPIIFANISSNSNFVDEQEVLLAMGTILHIESVELEGNIWKIYLHASPFNDALCWNVETVFPNFHSLLASTDNLAELMIAVVLVEMGNFEKAEQIYQRTSSYEEPFIDICRNLLKGYIDLYKIKRTHGSGQLTGMKEQLHKMKETLQQLKQLISPDDYTFQNVLEMEVKTYDLVMEQLFSLNLNVSDTFKFWEPLLFQIMRQRQLFLSTNKMVVDNSSIKSPMELIDATSPDNETFRLINSEEMQSVIDQTFTKNDSRRIGLLTMMASNTAKENKYDQAIGYLRNALLIPCDGDEHAVVYMNLAKVYEEQNNWPSALECYENIISMTHLSETSSILPHAHTAAGDMYNKIHDNHNAIVHYKKGVQLYCQRQSPHHPIVSLYKIIIGIIFEELRDTDAALKIFHEVTELDHFEHVKIACEYISNIHILRHDYDMAYYNSIETLKISQSKIPPDIDFIIDTHLLLVRIACLRNHSDEGYVHIEEAIVMAENHQCTEATRKEIESTLKIFSDLQCRKRSRNRN